jgi:peptidoglycan/LPS O-acetylase OafA/YrhL
MARQRLDHLDGIRAVLALWVVCNHIWLTIYPTVGATTNPRGVLSWLTDWMVYGHFAVVGFIVVSGYSLAISTTRNGNRLRGGVRVFLRRRFVRIVLPYWGALLISLALATTLIRQDTGTHWDAALPVTTEGVVLHALLLQDVATTGQINHAMWSIALEWHIYFLFPLLLLLRRRFGLLEATSVTVLFGLFISALFDGGLTFWVEANLLGCFAVGVAARELAVRRTDRSMPWYGLTVALFAGFVVACLGLGVLHSAQGNNTLLEPLFGFVVGSLLVALGREPGGRLRRSLSWRPLRWVGTISFSVYLLHAPVLQLVWQYLMRPLGLPLHDGWALFVLLVLGLPASVAVGWGYFQLVEKRCLPPPTSPPAITPPTVMADPVAASTARLTIMSG